MSYKILRIANINYQGALDRLYAEKAGLRDAPYAEQLEGLFSLGMIYTDAFSRGLRKLGVEAEEVVADAAPIQLSWAREHGIDISLDDTDWRAKVVMAQIKEFRPDVVYFQDVHGLPHAYRRQVKEYCDSVRLTILHKGYPGQFDEMQDFDMVFMSMPSLVKMYRERGIPAELHYHGFNGAIPQMLARIGRDNPPKAHPLTFLGSSGYGHGAGHSSRYWTLARLFQETKITGFIDERFSRGETKQPISKKILGQVPEPLLRPASYALNRLPVAAARRTAARINIERSCRSARAMIENKRIDNSVEPPCPISEFFPDRCHDPVYGLDMYEVLASSSVTFNLHANATGDSIGNLRMFEATGAGCCLLTDSGPNMGDLFEPDKEVVTYSSLEECLEKVRYLNDNPSVCEAIAKAGHERTMREHTIERRVENVHEFIRNNLSKKNLSAAALSRDKNVTAKPN